MQYFITFLEGIITFISPCILPMIPMYILYFAGDQGRNGRDRTLRNACMFTAGFTVVFVLLGLFAGTLGSLLNDHTQTVNILTGAVVTVFGLHYAGIFRIGFLDKTLKPRSDIRPAGAVSAFLFGIVFAVGWSPCTGAFLGSAMLLAASQASRITGMVCCFATRSASGSRSCSARCLSTNSRTLLTISRNTIRPSTASAECF